MADLDTNGTATSSRGFHAGATYAGMKTYGEGKLDLGILYSDQPCETAAVFTKSRLHAASIDIDREHLRDGRAQAVVVNAGIANASTGERGLNDARRVTGWVASRFDVPQDDVLICSTGVIGHFLPLDLMEQGVLSVNLQEDGGREFAQAIMTTDTRPKHASIRFGNYTIGGCAKGAGMIHPNMATMLAFLTTDAPVEQRFLQRALAEVSDRSFNLVSIDGDTSPSDTVFLMANGVAGGEPITADSPQAGPFIDALETLCVYLAREIARDGEGATKLIDVSVSGAASTDDARKLARLMTTSYLLKSAVHGADPNWGRIISVIGRSGVELIDEKVTVDLCGYRVFEHEEPTEFDPAQVSKAMEASEVTIAVDLGIGLGEARGWGCDLTADYVSINADYHT